MNGEPFAKATYTEGHPRLGTNRIKVYFIAYPGYLSLSPKKTDGAGILDIPWANIRGTRNGVVDKSTGGKIANIGLGWIPGIDMTHLNSPYDTGFWVNYWDDSYKREISVFFAVPSGDRGKAERYQTKIWNYKDRFTSNKSKDRRTRRR